MSRAPAAAGLLKAVLDTNIYIAAFQYPKGLHAALWQAAVAGRYRLVVSPAIIRETAEVLRADFAWEDKRVQRVVRTIAVTAGRGLIAPRANIYTVTADPDDNRILECAVEGEADIIVSNDNHLLDLKAHGPFP